MAGLSGQFQWESIFIDTHFLTGDYLQLFTDASGGVGYGAVCVPEWFWGTWPTSWYSLNITVLELYPTVADVETWGGRLGLTAVYASILIMKHWLL